MTKACKKILFLVFLALLFVLCLGVFAACGEEKGDTETYTVTVMADEITPAKGVDVQIRKGRNKYGKSKTTDENGKVEFELTPNDYTVELVAKSLPLSYVVPSGADLTLSKENHTCTVTLERSGYIVKLVNPDGTPYYVDGVQVTICELEGDQCKNPVLLGEDGIAFLIYPNHDYNQQYHVKVLNLPDDAKYDWDEGFYYSGANFSATVRDMTIVITTASTESVNMELKTKMTDAEKTEYAKTQSGYTATEQQYDAYKFTKDIAPNATVFFSFTPEISGTYHLYKTGTLSYVNQESAGGYLPADLVCTAGKSFTFTATNYNEITVTAEFVLTVPFSSYVQKSGEAGTVNLKVGNDATYAIVEFTPGSGALYTATVQGTTPAYVKTFTSKPNEFIGTQISADSFKAGASDKYAIPYGTSVPIYFAVAVKADAYPVEITVKIEKGAESTREYAEVQETLSQAEKPDGVLCGIPMDGTSTDKIILNNDDNLYHYETENGPVVYVKLTTPLDKDRFESGCSLAYAELTDTGIVKYAVNSEKENGAILTTDYTKFLRGFTLEEYKFTQGKLGVTLSMPNKSVYENKKCYANYVNADGAYPLTEELKAFLEAFYNTNKNAILDNTGIKTDAAKKDAWLFPCYYYGDESSNPTDAIVGEYTKFVKGYDGGTPVVADDEDENAEYNSASFKLVVARETFIIYANSRNGLSEAFSGNWDKDGETYTFTITDGYTDPDTSTPAELHFNVTFNQNTGKITLTAQENSDIVWEFELGAQA